MIVARSRATRSGDAGFADVSYYDLVLLTLPLVIGLLADRFLPNSRVGLAAGALLSVLAAIRVRFPEAADRGRVGRYVRAG